MKYKKQNIKKHILYIHMSIQNLYIVVQLQAGQNKSD